jgi:crotonobetainyl-CoA:carnitine CoA-transferase CaiB-like acyl-CoA transferase
VRCKGFTVEELQERLVAADVLTAPVNGAEDVARDPQILHNRMIVSVDHLKLGPLNVTGVPIHFHGTPCEVSQPPPLHGQHSRDILGELGYGPEEIQALLDDGAVATPAEVEKARSS